MIESLESRQMFAASFVDTSYGTDGATSIRFKTVATDQVRLSRLEVDSSGYTYVLARFEKSVQIRRLNAQGQLDTAWGAKNQILVFPTSNANVVTKMAVDANDRLLVLVGDKLYRFGGFGTIDTAFGGTGVLTLSDFSGKYDFDVDAGSRVYVTGSTPGGSGMLIERFISRGKLDRTFDGDGKYVAPLPASILARFKKPTGQAEFVRVLPDGDIMLAGRIGVSGYGPGTQAVRLNPDGTLDLGYGSRGMVSILLGQTSEAYYNQIYPISILANGSVSVYGVERFLLDSIGSSYQPAIYDPTGVRSKSEWTIDISVAEPNDGLLARTSLGWRSFNSSSAVDASFKQPGLFYSVSDAHVADDSSVLISATSARALNRVTVAKYLPSIYDQDA